MKELSYEIRVTRRSMNGAKVIKTFLYPASTIVAGDTGLATLLQRPEVHGQMIGEAILRDLAEVASKKTALADVNATLEDVGMVE